MEKKKKKKRKVRASNLLVEDFNYRGSGRFTHLQNRRIILVILHVDVLEGELSIVRPRGRWRILRDDRFLHRQICILENPLHGCHQRDHLGGLFHAIL